MIRLHLPPSEIGLGAQDLIDGKDEIEAAEGLLQGLMGAQHPGTIEVLAGVDVAASGNGDDLEGGKASAEGHDGFKTFLVGHEDVGDHQLERVEIDASESLDPVASGDDIVLVGTKDGGGGKEEFGVVVDEEDACHGLGRIRDLPGE